MNSNEIIKITPSRCICGNPNCLTPYGTCHCGCGKKTSIHKRGSKRDGVIAGVPVKFVPGHQFRGIKRPAGWVSPLKGIPRSESVKQKISVTKRGRLLSVEEKYEETKKYQREWKRANAKKAAITTRRYIEKNRDVVKARRRKKWRCNVNHRIAESLRIRLRKALKGVAFSGHTLELLGCSLEAFKAHLQRQFLSGMTWENYTYEGWHVDHIKPCALFDLSDPEQLAECFHYTNLQPLWRLENQSKGCRRAA